MTTSRTHAAGLLKEEHLVAADRKQLLNYLRASRMEVGLLLNFGPKAQFERLVYSNSNKLMLAGE